jgi:hypothetical protein
LSPQRHPTRPNRLESDCSQPGLPRRPAPLGGGAYVHLALTAPAAEQGLRALLRHQRSLDLSHHGSPHATPPRSLLNAFSDSFPLHKSRGTHCCRFCCHWGQMRPKDRKAAPALARLRPLQFTVCERQVGQESRRRPAVVETQSGVSGGVGRHRRMPPCRTVSAAVCRRVSAVIGANNGAQQATVHFNIVWMLYRGAGQKGYGDVECCAHCSER